MLYMGKREILNGNSPELERLLPSGQVKIGTCSTEAANETWHTQRIGPFRSGGGFDWWQFSWTSVLELDNMLSDALGPIGITAHFSGPVDEEGVAIPLRPSTSTTVFVRFWRRPPCGYSATSWSNQILPRYYSYKYTKCACYCYCTVGSLLLSQKSVTVSQGLQAYCSSVTLAQPSLESCSTILLVVV